MIKFRPDIIYTPEMAGSGQFGVCEKCNLAPTKDGHDGCLGTLDESLVMNACCGHGNDSQAYIQYWDGTDIRGKSAVDEQMRLRKELGNA